ncbi:MAG: hypothetical protein ABSB89_01030 [Candidatus Bathyarchaeia archaeon]|jgi:hypothetical protein
MSTNQDDIKTYVNMGRVFEDEKGELYFIKTTEKRKFIMRSSDNGEPIFEKTPCATKEEHVTPSELGFTKKDTRDIYVYKTENSELEEQTVYYSMTLTFEIPQEKKYKTAYLRKAKSGRVFLVWFDSGCSSEVSVNDSEFCKRSKGKRLEPDTIINRNAPIFTLSASGELELRLDSSKVW